MANSDNVNLVTPELLPLLRLKVEVGKPIQIDNCPQGNRKLIPILGGSFSGLKLNGKILPGGADSLIIRDDGCAEVDARYCLETDDGAILYLQDKGRRHGPEEVMKKLSRGEEVDPNDYYFRTCMNIETGSKNYLWLNNILIIGSGGRLSNQVVMDLYQLK